jgi:RNA polymerase sigma factor (TIGR02999 family)
MPESDLSPSTPPSPPPSLTVVLAEVAGGDAEARTRLLNLVYVELKRIAAAKMARKAPDDSLQPTALVHEVYLRLIGRHPDVPAFHDSAHFFAAAATAMRSILVDHARRKQAQKRGGKSAGVTLHPELVGAHEPLERVLQVHEALDLLAVEHARAARVVELLFFAGLSVDEAAGVLGVSDRTVKRDWRFGRAWLLQHFEEH